MPTALGLRAAVRLPAELLQPRALEQLNLPARVLEGLKRFARSDAGMLLLTGPAGSGKTTTIYALLSYIAAVQPGLAIIALEDPVERTLEGVTQIEVAPHGQLTYERALKSILRQDPQVLMLGEIRDAPTASLALQAALAGHRLISTMHAGSVGGAIARLYEMGCAGYQITSALYGVVAQRLLRRWSAEPPGYDGRSARRGDGRHRSRRAHGHTARRGCGGVDETVRRTGGLHNHAPGRCRPRRARVTTADELRRVLGGT